jgi:predicted transcriptional regulator
MTSAPISFMWTKERQTAALMLAEGHTQQEVANEVNVTDRTIRNWLSEEEFAAEVDRLSLMIGVASRAERLRITNKVIRTKVKEGIPETEKDLLEWLKFAQSETDGVKLDLGKLAASIAPAEAPVADRGSSAGDTAGATATTTDRIN